MQSQPRSLRLPAPPLPCHCFALRRAELHRPMRRCRSSRGLWRRGWRSQALCVKTNLHKAIHKQTETQTKKSDTKTILNTITIKNTNTNLKYKHKPKPQTLHGLINQYHHTFIIFISNMFSSDPYRMNATHLDFFVFRRLS